MDELQSILDATIDGKPIAEYLAESINLLDEGKITLKEVNVRTRKVAEINKAHAKALREYKKAHNIK